MNPNLFLDLAWKILFFVTILSSFYFVFSIVSLNSFSSFSYWKQMKTIKIFQLSLLTLYIATTIYLYISDNDFIIDCFGRFASDVGVFGVTRILSILWLVGFVVLTTRDLILYRKLNKLLLNSVIQTKEQKIRDNNLNEKDIKFYEVSDCFDPVVSGVLCSKIYIPSRIIKNKLLLKQVLSHEVIHASNFDGFWNLVSVLIHRLNWFNPLSYISFKKTKLQLEMATDEQAIEKFSLNITEYANSLVELVSKNKFKSLYTMNVSGDFQQIQNRLVYLKKIQKGSVNFSLFYVFIMILTLFFGFSRALASIRMTPKDSFSSQMCFQVEHELIIESWIMTTNKTEPNKCE